MSQIPISGLPSLATPLNPALQLEVAQGTTTSSKVTLSQILTDPIITGRPTITDFTLAAHDHSNNVNGGQLTNSALISGEFSSITGIGTQTQTLDMGGNNISPAGFIDMQEIPSITNPDSDVGRLYVQDNVGVTTLFFRDNAGTATNLLALGSGVFLPLAGGTMDSNASIAFTNTGTGGNPVISAFNNNLESVVKISDNLLVPEFILLGEDLWRINADSEEDFFISTPIGDGSHNVDIVSDVGEISFQTLADGNDFTAKFVVKQFNALATTQDIALTIDAQIVDGTDTGPNPVIAINARQVAADIDTRPILGIQNNGIDLWEISKDGDVTQFGNLLMGSNDITFQNEDWKISSLTNNILNFETQLPTESSIRYTSSDVLYEVGLQNATISIDISQNAASTIDSNALVFEHFISVLPDNDAVSSTTAIYDIRILRQGGTDIINRPLMLIRNHNTQQWLLDNDGTVTQSGNLVMGSNELQFDDVNTFIHEDTNQLELHVGSNKQVRMVIGPQGESPNDFTYQFGGTNSNWGGRGMTNMATLSFSSVDVEPALNISIQRGNNARDGGSNDDLELDANQSGEIIFRILDTEAVDQEEYNFGATTANFNNNQISNAVLLSTVTGNTGITGLGILSEIVFVGTDNTIFPKDSNTNLRINANIDLECEVGNGGALVISNRSGTDLFSFSSAEADWKDNNLINMGILEFSNTKNRLFQSAGGGDLRIQADTQVSLKVEGTNQSFTVGKNFIEWDSDTNDTALFELEFSQETPEAATITTWDYNGINLVSQSVTYARMEVNQVTLDDGAEEGSMVFSVMLAGTLTDFVSLNGETGNLELQPDIDIDFTDFAGSGVLSLATDNLDNLTFQTSVILTEANVLANRTTGVPLDTDTFLFGNSAGTNLRQATFDDLQFSVIAGNGEGHTTGSNVFYSFFSHDAPNGTVGNREVAMPATMEVRELTVMIGTNGKSESISVGVTKNGSAQAELTKTVESTDEDTTLTKTGSVTFNATDRISFFVAASPGSGTIEIISFSCLLGQKSV